jgi:hypothetical protein
VPDLPDDKTDVRADRIAQTVRAIAARTPDELQLLRSEIAAADADDPDAKFDREALERFDALAAGIETAHGLQLLSDAEAVFYGLDPALSWAHVDQGPVEATIPPPAWAGALPETCGWPTICGELGPCPRSLIGDPCRLGAQPCG